MGAIRDGNGFNQDFVSTTLKDASHHDRAKFRRLIFRVREWWLLPRRWPFKERRVSDEMNVAEAQVASDLNVGVCDDGSYVNDRRESPQKTYFDPRVQRGDRSARVYQSWSF